MRFSAEAEQHLSTPTVDITIDTLFYITAI